MHEVFDEEDFKPGLHPRDTEVTLGPMLLAGLIAGLVLLCILCYWLGYTIGSHSARNATANAQQTAAGAALPSAATLAKPSAFQQSASQQNAPSSQPQPNATSTDEASDASSAPEASSTAGQTAPANALMVQVATLPHQEDADVLVGALQKRGYAVAVHRDPTDGLFHVRIGPFSSRANAYATRQKLLNDGYNAVVE